MGLANFFGQLFWSNLILQTVVNKVLAGNHEYILAAICIKNYMFQINELQILSRHRNADNIPTDLMANFTEVAAKYGVDLKTMCSIDNTECTD